jgi:hypothetical protein
MIRIASSLVARKALLVLLAILATAIAVPAAAQAHTTLGVPYHTSPDPAEIQYRYGWCEYWFYNPVSVYGFAREYVYWRPIVAVPAGNQWQYRYGEWRRAISTPTGMSTGWYSQQWPSNDWFTADGKSVISVSPGPNRWLGFQIYYSSNAYTHTEWLGSLTC